MKTITGYQKLNDSWIHPVLTIGNFDGIHVGHQKIISLAMEKARARKGHCVVYTFRPHPQIALRPEGKTQLLSTYEEKLELLEKLGVDAVIEEPFTSEFFQLNPTDFFKQVLLGRLGIESLVVGYDFSFGRERQGHLDLLRVLCQEAKVELTIVPPQRLGKEVVSSSKIRQALSEKRVELANQLLGRPFSYRGVVFQGDQRGRKLGFPTANIRIEEKAILPFGVYATMTRVDGQPYPSITNVGIRPTFQNGSGTGKELVPIVESHLLNQDLNLYGKRIEVEFLSSLRDEMKFQSVELLKEQICIDIQKAKVKLDNI